MQLDFDVLQQPQQQTYFGPLLQINSNENDYYNLFLDYRKGELQQLIVYSRENLRKLPIPRFKTDGNEQEINIKLTLFQQKKEFTLQVGDTLYTINNLGFKPKAGYKFTFVADKEKVLDPSGKPALQINNIHFIETTDKHVPKSIWYWFLFILIIDLLVFGGVHIRKKTVTPQTKGRHHSTGKRNRYATKRLTRLHTSNHQCHIPVRRFPHLRHRRKQHYQKVHTLTKSLPHGKIC